MWKLIVSTGWTFVLGMTMALSPAMAEKNDIPLFPADICHAKSVGESFSVMCSNDELQRLDMILRLQYSKIQTVNAAHRPAMQTALTRNQLDWTTTTLAACQPEESPLLNEQEKRHWQSVCLQNAHKQRLQAIKQYEYVGLRLHGHQVNASGEVSQVCLDFSATVKRRQNLPLRSYIEVDKTSDYAVRMTKRQICLAGLPHGGTYTVTVKEGLQGVGGLTLLKTASQQVQINGRASDIRFAGHAYILPRHSAPQVTLSSVNVSTASLRVLAVDERGLRQILEYGRLGRQITAWRENQIREDWGRLVWQGQVEIDAISDKTVATALPLHDMGVKGAPGIYIIQAQDNDQYATQWVFVTDIGTTLYAGRDQVSANIRSLKTAQPMANATVKLIARNNRVLTIMTSASDGWVDFAPELFQGAGGDRPSHLTIESEKGDFAFLDIDGTKLDLSERGAKGIDPLKPIQSYSYFDRNIYRPGEQVEMGILLRNARAASIANIPLTVKLFRPSGKEVLTKLVRVDDLGYGRLQLPLSASADTGAWRIDVFLDPEDHAIESQSIEVQEFVPERLRLAAKAERKVAEFGQDLAVQVQADYLFGAPGNQLTARGTARLIPDRKPFEQWSGFSFGLLSESVGEQQRLANSKTNAQGAARLVLPPVERPDVSSPLAWDFDIEVLDTDGRSARTGLTLPAQTSPVLLGIRPDFDQGKVGYGETAGFTVLAVDQDGKPLPNRQIMVNWVREHREYRWYQQSGEWRSTYDSWDQSIEIETLTTDANGQAKTSRSFDQWMFGRAIISDDETGMMAESAFRVGWVSDAASPQTPDSLVFSVSQKDAKPGDRIEAFVKAPFAGKALITVALDGVIWRQEMDLPQEGAKISVPVTEAWKTGAYIMATAYRPGQDDDQRGPGRAIGMDWVSVDRAKRSLDVAFDVPEIARPQQRVDIPYTITGPMVGKEPIRIEFFAVDEGILQLTDFVSPDPRQSLLSQQQLPMTVNDLYGRLIQATTGRPGRLSTGGDDRSARNLNQNLDRVFKTVALRSNVMDVGADGRGVVSFDLPDMNSELRIFAVAHSKTAIGSGEDRFVVRSPVVADLLPPRFMAPNDEAQWAFRFTNLDGPEGSYEARLSTSDHLEVTGTRALVFDGGNPDSQTGAFALKALRTGSAVIDLLVTGPDGFELTRQWTLSVRASQPWVTSNQVTRIDPTENAVISLTSGPPILPGTGSQTWHVAPFADIGIQSLVNSLDRYPYGCLEQTTSRAFPLLFFKEAAESFQDIRYEKDNLDQRVTAAIQSVLDRQKDDGAFGLWTRWSSEEDWLTAYAMDFLSTARARGFAVNDAAYDRSIAWMRGAAASRYYKPDARAYMLYVLAKNGHLTADSFRYLAFQIEELPHGLMARAHILAAKLAMGEDLVPITVEEIVQHLKTYTHDNYYYSYGSVFRDLSAVLTLPSDIFADANSKYQIAQIQAGIYEKQRYLSTQDQAWALQAMASMATEFSADAKILVDGQTYKNLSGLRGALTHNIAISNQGDNPVFVTTTREGIPAEALPAAEHGFSIKRQIWSHDLSVELDQNTKSGDLAVVVISGKSLTSQRRRALVVDLLPAGWEIQYDMMTPHLQETITNKLGLQFSDAQFIAERDDRYVAAVDLSNRYRDFALAYVVRAVSPGQYTHPAIFVEDMYQPAIHARGKVQALTVTASEN